MGNARVAVAIQYCQNSAEDIKSYANNICTSAGGTHITGFRMALTRALNRYARAVGFLNDTQESFTGDAVRQGLTAIVAVRLPNPSFNNSSKDRLSNTEMVSVVSKVVGRELLCFLKSNPQIGGAILEKVAVATKGKKAG